MSAVTASKVGSDKTVGKTKSPVGNYLFGGLVGEGSYAKVYVAKRKVCKSLLAAKVMEILFIV